MPTELVQESSSTMQASGALPAATTDKGKGAYAAPPKKTSPTKPKGIVMVSLVVYALVISEAEGEELVLGKVDVTLPFAAADILPRG